MVAHRKRVLVTCDGCGAQMERTPSSLPGFENAYCGWNCMVKFRQENAPDSWTCPPERAWITERRLSNYMPVPEAGCWIWLGWKSAAGYGGVRSHGKSFSSAHRYFYTHLVGPIPDGMLVLHKCDTPICVNPDHLFLGDHLANNEDMWLKGRAFRAGQSMARRKPYRTEMAIQRLALTTTPESN